MKKSLLFLIVLVSYSASFSQIFPVTFDNLSLQGQDTFWNGSDGSGDKYSNGLIFRNTYTSPWQVWSGFALSSVKDNTTAGFENQYAAYTGGGINKTPTYAVGTGKAGIVLEKRGKISGMYIANNTYTALSMKYGDAFAKKFGGNSGNDADYFKLKCYGMSNGSISDSTAIFLADFRSSDNSKDFILDDWTWLDLESWHEIDSLWFDYESSDTGKFGMNTPMFFCLDDVNGAKPTDIVVTNTFESFGLDTTGVWNGSDLKGGFLMGNTFFENSYNTDWQSWSGWAVSNQTDTITGDFSNQYSVISGRGYKGSEKYLVSYDNSVIRLPYNEGIQSTMDIGLGMMINNSTYVYKSMQNGDMFSKKFGGADGHDKDYFRLLVKGYDKSGTLVDTVEFYLADFRFDDDSKDYIIKDWTLLDLSSLVFHRAIRLEFTLSSSDTGIYGMNTPAFFCADEFMVPFSLNTPNIVAKSIKVYPNPATNEIQLPLKGNALVNIVDSQGKLISSTQKGAGKSMDVSFLQTGIYFIQINQANQIYTAKFVKQ